ncbi:MAG: ribokinase [Geminicoccaceae bacterium]|nr:ribokinase [Geminicoccaceae bacterium]
MKRILTSGITVLDIMLPVKKLPAGDGKTLATGRQDVIGGIAANAALTVKKLDGIPVLSTRLGDDSTGDEIMRQLVAAGIDTSAVEWINGARSSLTAAIVDASGERMLINHSDAHLFHGRPDLSVVEADGVITDTRWLDGAFASLEFARERDIPGLLDFDMIPDARPYELIATASHVAFGAQGLHQLTGIADPADGLIEVRRRYPGWLAVTAGGKGVYWLEDNEVCHIPAFEVEVVDTLAAGDVFHGALALALAEGQPMRQALRFASAAAAIKCTQFGGGAGIPTRSQLERFLGERSGT